MCVPLLHETMFCSRNVCPSCTKPYFSAKTPKGACADTPKLQTQERGTESVMKGSQTQELKDTDETRLQMCGAYAEQTVYRSEAGETIGARSRTAVTRYAVYCAPPFEG